ncbi:DNA-binding protein, partial [Klebsiella pneumoniae]|nr:DNA-binding protein [Klebsiella pneumoniae]
KARAELIEVRRTRYDCWAYVLGKMVMVEVTTSNLECKPMASIEVDLKSLQRASGTLATCFEISSNALVMEKEEVG